MQHGVISGTMSMCPSGFSSFLSWFGIYLWTNLPCFSHTTSTEAATSNKGNRSM